MPSVSPRSSRHELTHAFIRANAPGRLPLWFEEGLAQYFQGVTLESARRELIAGRRTFSSLDAVDGELRGGPHVAAAYAAAAIAVAELVRMDGLWLPRRILEYLTSAARSPRPSTLAAGLDLAEFESRWSQLQR